MSRIDRLVPMSPIVTPDAAAGRTPDRALLRRWFAIGLAIECLLFLWLCSLGRLAFLDFISTPDTPEYVRVAQHLAGSFVVPPTYRTLGYSLFLAPWYVLGGQTYGPYLVVMAQLALNLLLTVGCWRLLERLVPTAGFRVRLLATAIFFVAGLGMASYLMTDFLGAVLFGLFVYGLLFWRSPGGVAMAGTGLALATLTRPTFTYLPLVLPAAAVLAGRITRTVPRRHVAVFVLCSVGATGVSVAYQYSVHNYLGPSPVMIIPIQETLYYGDVSVARRAGIDYVAFAATFQAEVATRAGRPFAVLSLREREDYARELFREAFQDQPGRVVVHFLRNAVKYLLVPIESLVQRFAERAAGEPFYVTYLRPGLGLICLPIWILALWPPRGAGTNLRTYHLLAVLLVLYVIGLSAITTASGERIRFPILAFMLPVAVWNLHRLEPWLRGLLSGGHLRSRGEAPDAHGGNGP